MTSRTPAEAAANKEKMQGHLDAVDHGMSVYMQSIHDADTRAQAETLAADIRAYFDDNAAMLDIANTNVAIGRWAAVEGQFDGLLGQVADLIVATQEHGTQAVQRADTANQTGKSLLIGFTAVAILLGVGLALLIARSIARPLAVLRDGLGRVGEGDLTMRVDADGSDEVSDVSTAFNDFATRMQQVVGRVVDAARSQITLAQELVSGAEQSGQASAQIATTIDEVAHGSSEQAEATSRVSDTMQEMGEGVRRVSQASESAAAVAEDADRRATEGGETVRDAMEAMGSIEQRVGEASEIVAELGERSAMVGQIVDTISAIASETNLLALNAAIEAARAGEQGRGFAVVAEEVRKLAENTQDQVGSISTIVSEIQQHTSRAVEAMNSGRTEVQGGAQRVSAAGEAFGEIRGRVEELSGQVMSVAAAAQQLDAGASEIQEALTGVAAVSEENAAAVQQVSASTEETSATAQETAGAAQRVAASSQELAELVRAFTV
ncbi:MAG: methyl-accepting chemotaxis protein [Thermoleophilia bacterium]